MFIISTIWLHRVSVTPKSLWFALCMENCACRELSWTKGPILQMFYELTIYIEQTIHGVLTWKKTQKVQHVKTLHLPRQFSLSEWFGQIFSCWSCPPYKYGGQLHHENIYPNHSDKGDIINELCIKQYLTIAMQFRVILIARLKWGVCIMVSTLGAISI